MKLLNETLFICLLIIFVGQINCDFPDATKPRTCHLCEGINCLRTDYSKTTECSDPLDVCATIFDGFTVVAQGCLLNLPELHRNKCDQSNSLECHKCYSSLCNNLGRTDFKCYVCDSSKNPNCSSDLSVLSPIRCPISSAINSYCYVQDRNGTIIRGCSTNLVHQRNCFGSKNCALCLPGDANDGIGCNSFGGKNVPNKEEENKPNNSNKFYLGLGAMLLIFVNIFLN